MIAMHYAFAIAGHFMKRMAIELNTCLYMLFMICRWRCHLPLRRTVARIVK